MKTVNDYHAIIDNAVDGLLNGTLKVPVAVEVNNAVGKKIGLLKLQLDYQNYRNKYGRRGAVIEILEDSLKPGSLVDAN